MSDTLESLQRKKETAGKLGNVVRTMKALAASNISQYEMAVAALQDYFRTISLSLYAYILHEEKRKAQKIKAAEQKPGVSIAIFLGTDQGLVGRFNDSLATFAWQQFAGIAGKKEIWVVGEQMASVFSASGMMAQHVFSTPAAVDGITALVDQLQDAIEAISRKNGIASVFIFYNAPQAGGYAPVIFKLLPLDEHWKDQLAVEKWPSDRKPQIIDKHGEILASLAKEYLFVSMYKTVAESLATENASRLEAMQRAQKNIEELQEDLRRSYNRLRQNSIDEELFDVIAGFEALKKEKK